MADNIARMSGRPDDVDGSKRSFLRLACLAPLVAAGTLWASPQTGHAKLGVQGTDEAHSNAVAKIGETDRTTLEAFGREIEQLQTLLGIPGLSVAIVKDQQLLWAKGFGFADLEKRMPATKETPYAVASVTKPVAATLLMQLVENGRVGLDEPARRYSTGFKDDSVRIRHLLTHTSEGTAGEKYAYNGDRFRELTEVIEQASGASFRQVLARHILDEVGMSRSVPGHDVLDNRDEPIGTFGAETVARYEGTLAGFAKPYTVSNGRAQRTDYPPRGLNAAAGLISTVVDLAKFDVALDRQMLLRRGSLDEAWTPAVSSAGNILPYGLGWFVQRHQGTKLVWHYGYWQQFSALYLKVPEHNLTLIVLANSNGLSAPFGLGDGDVLASPFACSFLRTFGLGEGSGRVVAADGPQTASTTWAGLTTSNSQPMCERARAAVADWIAKDNRRQVALDPAIYDAYVGEYELRRPGFFDTKIIITRDQDKLIGSFSGELTGPQNRFELTPESPTRFFWKGEAVTFTFNLGPNRKATHLVWREFGRKRCLSKTSAAK